MIRIIGGSGSGKSFIAEKIAQKFNIGHYDLDNIFWDNQSGQYGVKTPESIRNQKLEEIVNKNSWVIEGVFYAWTYQSFKKADKIFILKPNVYLQHYRVLLRFVKRKLRWERSDKKESVKSLIDLIKWNHRFNKKSLADLKQFTKEFQDKTIVLKRNDDVFKYL